MTDDDVLKEALERFREAQDASDFNRNDAYDDIRFSRLGDQWPHKIRKTREEEGRPCLTVNKLPAFIRQVVNDARQNKPSVIVHPVDSGADEDTAQVVNGLVRSIWRNGSGGDVATDTAIDHAVTGGFGFFRIAIDYAHDDTFNMECRVERIANPLMVHWDVSSTEFDASDWDYAFVSDWLTEDEFKRRYPNAEPVSFEGDDMRDDVGAWLMDDKIRVAEYWSREAKTRKLLLLGNPLDPNAETRAIREEYYEGDLRALADAQGLVVMKEREVTYYEVTRRIINGQEVLEEEIWPGSMIPICPVWGDEVIVDGRRHFRSMIRDARDPQTMFNFWRSASTELVALAPRAPFLMEEGSIPKGEEAKWQTANNRSHPFLLYAKGVNIPQRQTFAGVPAGALQEALNASDDMKATIGIYDASLGARSNETSGRAILARQREADVSNFHFIDNLSRAIRYAGRVLVEIIPAVYSPQETIRILGEDMAEKVVKLTTEDGGAVDPETGKRELYNLTVGKYDVDVKSGPSYSTQREEAREVLLEIMRSVPQSAALLGDIFMEHLDFVGADRAAERLKMLLPPNVQQAEGIVPAPQMPGAPMASPGAMPGQPPQGGGGGF